MKTTTMRYTASYNTMSRTVMGEITVWPLPDNDDEDGWLTLRTPTKTRDTCTCGGKPVRAEKKISSNRGGDRKPLSLHTNVHGVFPGKHAESRWRWLDPHLLLMGMRFMTKRWGKMQALRYWGWMRDDGRMPLSSFFFFPLFLCFCLIFPRGLDSGLN